MNEELKEEEEVEYIVEKKKEKISLKKQLTSELIYDSRKIPSRLIYLYLKFYFIATPVQTFKPPTKEHLWLENSNKDNIIVSIRDIDKEEGNYESNN